MGVHDYLVILVGCSITMLACRVLPLVLLRGRELPPVVVRALGLIPPAAFAALVANDLFSPDRMAGDPWAWAAPLLAAAAVAVIAVKTKSMAWCIVGGVACLGMLPWLPGAR